MSADIKSFVAKFTINSPINADISVVRHQSVEEMQKDLKDIVAEGEATVLIEKENINESIGFTIGEYIDETPHIRVFIPFGLTNTLQRRVIVHESAHIAAGIMRSLLYGNLGAGELVLTPAKEEQFAVLVGNINNSVSVICDRLNDEIRKIAFAKGMKWP